ncbi:uncharacterized protein [Macrobrachium rosenbergii]|uniref:Caspase 3C n=2 Tax=Macrobrachium rosenbergii TaxID=79674 RepID=G9BRM3_MACRS|nr:caspase 3C [Macrobrachium rosenbergii]
MAVVRDSASLGSMDDLPCSNSDIFLTHQRLSADTNAALYELDDNEAISMVFLLLDVEYLAKHGFKYCQYICNGRLKETMDVLVTVVKHTKESLSSVIEALYIIGRYDLLEDHLGLRIDQKFSTVFTDSIDEDRKALYCVFAGMAQEEADCIIQARLRHWSCPESGRPLEETFARNLSIENYYHLITDLYDGLMDENKETLALYLHPFIRRIQQSMQVPILPSWNVETTYPPPTCYPHGLCIIINVKSFMKPRVENENIPSLGERHGSDIDKERLAGTFKLFGFHVMYLDNPDHEQIQRFFKNLRVSPKLAVVSCLAVCVMTHGDEYDQIFLHDRSCLSITDLRKLCFSQVLHDKPRLYFIQACRGERALQPIFLQQDVCTVAHAESNCLISAATVKGYSAVRSQTAGSWYITDLCQALQELGHLSPIKTVLHRTRETLMARVGSMNNKFVTQLSEDKDTLTKDVQLVRADEEHFLEGIIDLVRLEVVEKLVEDLFEEALSAAESSGDLDALNEKMSSFTMN